MTNNYNKLIAMSKVTSQCISGLWFIFFLPINIAIGQPEISKFKFVDPNIILQKWVGKKFPEFNILDKYGNIYNNKLVENKLVVVNFWSTTCQPCIEEMPLLSKLVEKYADKGVIFLAPAPENASAINSTVSSKSFKYIILPQAEDLFKTLALSGYPYHLIIDRNGFIRYIRTGSVDNTGKKIAETGLPEAIERLL